MSTADTNNRIFHAIIWLTGTNQPGERVTVLARNTEEAKRLLEDQYGRGNVFDLHNPEDADMPR